MAREPTISAMDCSNPIGTTYDFRSDTPTGKDPDTWSPTLCRYHKRLWGKRLPSGVVFDLAYKSAPFYLHHCSDLGEFWLSTARIPCRPWQDVQVATDRSPFSESALP